MQEVTRSGLSKPAPQGAGPPRRRRFLRTGLLAVLALGVMAFAAPAAMADPFPCTTDGYIVQTDAVTNFDTVLNRVERQPDGSYSLVPLGTRPQADGALNALGFRPQDGLMYAWDVINFEVVQIGQDAGGNISFDSLGAPAGAPAGYTTAAGVFLDDGTYLSYDSALDVALIIDVTTTPTPTVIDTLTVDRQNNRFGWADWAINPVDGKLYAPVVDTQGDADPANDVFEAREIIVDRAAGTVSVGASVGQAGDGGSAWFSPHSEGVLFVYQNVPGGVFSTDIATGAFTFHGAGPGAGGVDATACAFTLAVTKDANPRTVATGSDELTYTYTVTSRGIGTNPVQFVDQLPAGMTYVPGGVSVNPPGVGTTNAYDGTDALSVGATMSQNDRMTITARVAVAPGIACDRDVDNQAQGTLSSPGLPPVTLNSDDPTTATDPEDPTTVHLTCGQADLVLKKSGPSSYTPDGKVSWTIKVTNKGPQASSGSTVTDSLPKGVTDVSSPTKGCKVKGDKVTCNVGELAVGESHKIKVTGTAPTGGGKLKNSAKVKGKDPDPNKENNEDEEESKPSKPKLAVDKRAGAKSATAGETVKYKLTARNVGKVDARNVRVCDVLPAELTPVSLGGGDLSGGKLCWKIKRLNAGKSKRFTFKARIDADADAGMLQNTATLNGAGIKDRDKAGVEVASATGGGETSQVTG